MGARLMGRVQSLVGIAYEKAIIPGGSAGL
jgi:hypothetical protein